MIFMPDFIQRHYFLKTENTVSEKIGEISKENCKSFYNYVTEIIDRLIFDSIMREDVFIEKITFNDYSDYKDILIYGYFEKENVIINFEIDYDFQQDVISSFQIY